MSALRYSRERARRAQLFRERCKASGGVLDAYAAGSVRTFRTPTEYRWAKKLWLRRRGGSLIGTLAIAIFFGALTGSDVLLVLLVVFALVATAYARSRP